MNSLSNIVLRTGNTFLTKNAVTCPMFTPFVRWRKRRWAPKAASKEFYVRQKPDQDPEEYAELTWRFRHYRTYLKSVCNYLKEEIAAKEAISTSDELINRETQLYQKLMALNDKWNDETRQIREARELKATAEEQEEILRYSINLDQEKEKRRIAADSRVQMEEEASQYFIREENLQQEIEKALNKQSNYNFHIDLEGNRYMEKGDFSVELANDRKDSQPRIFNDSSESPAEGQQILN